MFVALKIMTASLLLLNAVVGGYIYLTQGITPYASLIGVLFAAAGLSLLDREGKNEED